MMLTAISSEEQSLANSTPLAPPSADPLAAWLETRSVAETARRVYAHYNTVRKRLERIEELLGPVLTDPRRALDLAVAIRVHERSGPPR